MTINLWYKNAVLYCVDVDCFQDSNGDGVGDFRGLTERLDHIEALGATCIWLLPFYPSPDRDNGYDITDYYSVDPRLGTLGDFVEFTHAAHGRGLKVIVDLVVNHTSRSHPWFEQSRSDPSGPYGDWYVWRKDKPADAAEGVIFPGVQKTTWTYDRKRGEYYFHRFYEHQADLNIGNPAVREEIARIMGFWLALGVSGFRIDAVPFILEDLQAHQGWDPHRYLSEMQTFLSWRRAEAVMLAEANITMDQADEYFGTGDRLHLIFNFPLNQTLFLALARSEADPLKKFLLGMPKIPDGGQWATFLRNHDELDLGRLSGKERGEVFAAFGPEKRMQLYDRGIRRRLAAMLGGNRDRIAMAMSVMLALPGTPVIWYGDEIGMGDDLSLEERHAVRTPMQWSARPNGGFSSAKRADCVRPPVKAGAFGYETLNAEVQSLDEASLLSAVRALVRARRTAPEIGWGEMELLDAPDGVLAMAHRWRGRTSITVHNLSAEPAEFAAKDLDLSAAMPLLAGSRDRLKGRGTKRIALGAYDYAWFRLGDVV